MRTESANEWDFTNCIDDELYAEIMNDADKEHAEWKKADKKLKEKYRHTLKNLMNVKTAWEWLNEHDGWTPLGIYDVRIADKLNGYYNKTMPHCKIQDDKYKHLDMHWQKECKSEMGVNHIFIIQYTHGEDSYSGFIAMPLNNRKYFLVGYVC